VDGAGAFRSKQERSRLKQPGGVLLKECILSSDQQREQDSELMNTNTTAARSGTFRIGGDVQVNRLGFGSMRITGAGIWGEPADRAEAIRTLQRLPGLAVNFIDTADSYGPDVSEPLIREALHPYCGMLVATKSGLARTGPDRWMPLGRPEYLIQQAHKSRRQLGVDQIGLWQLHRIDPQVPRSEQFGAIETLLNEGVIRHAGLCEVSVAEIRHASKVFKVATVQNRYNLADRASEDVLEYCEQHGIGFIPWYPLAAGNLAKQGSVLDGIARRHHAAPSQIALAWLLKRSPVMLPIPGTSKVSHLEENVAAVTIDLSAEDFASLDNAAAVRRALVK
jgi:pyridoxine 4-dehydrogenase